MARIHVLDEHIANQIAAGEVVERPASIVKELVENAIDAGSTKIDIAIEEGGLKSIRVTDNGAGIAADDILTAFERHATSKIATGQDLFQIRSLGFRGEALPSIAAVSKLTCISSDRTDGLGRRLVIEGGHVLTSEETAASRGTDIRVSDLFYNTPARLKYMKTIQTELNHISNYMYRLSLAHPAISFTFSHQGKVLLQTLGNGDLLQVIAAIYGAAIARQMIQVSGESLDYQLSGYIGKPEATRANRFGMSVIVNGRYTQNYALSKAMMNAYHTWLPINRFPLAVLNIQMAPSLLDVNVHPAKLEVRFSKEQELLQFIEQTVREVLQKQVHIPRAKMKGPAAKVHEQIQWTPPPDVHDEQQQSASEPGREQQDASDPGRVQQSRASEPGLEQHQRTSDPQEQSSEQSLQSDEDHSGSWQQRAEDFTAAPTGLSNASNSVLSNASNPASTNASNLASHKARIPSSPNGINHASPKVSNRASYHDRINESGRAARQVKEAWSQFMTAKQETEQLNHSFPILYPVGQVHSTYIVAQNEDGLYLIDQHAAHERIHYEAFYAKFSQTEPYSQQLLVPITLEFTPSESEVIAAHLALFEQVGVELASFGRNSFIVRSYPSWFPQGDEKGIIEEMAEWVIANGKGIDIAKMREQSAILCACKAAIKANQRLSLAEIEALLQQLRQCNQPYTCPHGRPIMISYSTYELAKMFKRV